ncbi:MAG: phage portal protein, partial [Elusimicrobiota bacterium]
MGFIDKTFKKIAERISAKNYYGLFSSQDTISDLKWSKEDYLDKAAICLYLNKGIRKRAEKVAQTEWFLENSKGEPIEGDKDNWLELLNNPNQFLCGMEFWELFQKYKDISGSSFIWKELSGKKVNSLHLLRPDRVKVYLSDGDISKYEYTKGAGEVITYKPEEIIYSYHPDPLNQLKGESIIKSGARIVDTQIQIDELQNNIIKNGGKIEGILKFKTERLTEKQLKDMKARYQKEYGAAKKSGLPMFFGGDINYTQTGLTPKELDFLEAKKMTLNDIVIMTGVPKSILGSVDDIKYSNARESERIFVIHTIKPLIDNLKNVLNSYLLPEDIRVNYVDPTPKDAEETRKTIQLGYDVGALTVNEMREELGYEPIEGGDTLYMPFNRIPTDQVKETKSMSGHPLRNKEFRKQFKELRDKQLSEEEKKAELAMKRYFQSQRDRLLEKIEAGQGTPPLSEIINREEEEKIAEATIEPLLLSTLMRGGKETANFINSFTKADNLIVSSVIRAWIKERSSVFASIIMDTTMKDLEKVFTDAYNTEDPRQSLIRALQEKYTDYDKVRATMIAKTEIHGAFQKGNFEAYKQADIPIKFWVAVQDDRTRDSHSSLDGEEVSINSPFSNGLMFPGDPSG